MKELPIAYNFEIYTDLNYEDAQLNLEAQPKSYDDVKTYFNQNLTAKQNKSKTFAKASIVIFTYENCMRLYLEQINSKWTVVYSTASNSLINYLMEEFLNA